MRNTAELVRTFIALGFKAVICCVDLRVLAPSCAGKEIDREFLRQLPSHVDPCGENGEFHSFVYAGPMFTQPIRFARGEVVVRDTHFCFCDLVPTE